MHRILRTAAILAVIGSTTFAQDFNKGLEAARAGDFATAMQEWRPLAEQGNDAAQFNLALMYHSGDGVLKDEAEAVKWYRLAAEQGDGSAQASLAIMYKYGKGVLKDMVTAHMWYNIASANGAENSGKWRDKAEQEMTREQIAEATRRAKVCMASD